MKISGIYQIQSIIHPDRIYVGSSVWFSHRKDRHLSELRHKKHNNKKLQSHFNKYGESDLQFFILLLCGKDVLISEEQHYIDTLNPYFNICRIAGSQIGLEVSNETRKKLRDTKLGYKNPMFGKEVSLYTINKMSLSHLGKHHSDETTDKIRIAHENIPKSKEHIQHMKDAWVIRKQNETKETITYRRERAFKKPVIQYSKDMRFIKEWLSSTDVYRDLGIINSSISNCLVGLSNTAGGFIWKFKYEKEVA